MLSAVGERSDRWRRGVGHPRGQSQLRAETRYQSGHPSPNLIRKVFELPISNFFGKYGLYDWATNMITAIGLSYGRSGLQFAGEG